MSDWQQYADSVIRETYPPIPSKGGDLNKEMPDAVAGMIASQHQAVIRNEAEFRAKQRIRRLQTRGEQAMRDPEETPSPQIPDDPALEEYKAAGWLS